jgi:hypothetical protein
MRRRSVTLSKPAASPSMTTAAIRGESRTTLKTIVLAVAGDAGNAHDLAAATSNDISWSRVPCGSSGSSESL